MKNLKIGDFTKVIEITRDEEERFFYTCFDTSNYSVTLYTRSENEFLSLFNVMDKNSFPRIFYIRSPNGDYKKFHHCSFHGGVYYSEILYENFSPDTGYITFTFHIPTKILNDLDIEWIGKGK